MSGVAHGVGMALFLNKDITGNKPYMDGEIIYM